MTRATISGTRISARHAPPAGVGHDVDRHPGEPPSVDLYVHEVGKLTIIAVAGASGAHS